MGRILQKTAKKRELFAFILQKVLVNRKNGVTLHPQMREKPYDSLRK